MFGGWILIALVVYLFYKNKGMDFSNKNEAEERLKERYINGEIDEETYLKMKRTISK
jgi:uncharacterized membrane protein